MKERFLRKRMGKKRLATIAASALLAALVLPASAAAPDVEQPTRDAPIAMISQGEGVHTKYMNGSDGWFLPEQNVTRAELAQMLYEIAEDRPGYTPALYDVAADAWYAPAAEAAVGLGLMTDDYGMFRPGDPATRAECAYALSMLLPYSAQERLTFPDVQPGYWAYDAISRAGGCGLFLGDSTGNFHPDSGLKRCEAVAVFNRLLGRSPDLDYIQARDDLRTFPDVSRTHWAYGEIMEATVTHEHLSVDGRERWASAVSEPSLVVEQPPAPPTPTLPDGPQRIDGRLYWVVGESFAKSCNMNGLYFDENGWYTTGNAELDEKLNAIVEELTNDSMTRDEKLEALFNYCRDSFTYLKRPLISKGQTGWEAEYALYFLKNGKGNCFNFSAAYCLLARELGLPAYCVVGRALNSPHGWVEIPLDGATYIFDPQLAWRYLHNWGKTGYNFFKQPVNKTTVKYTR